MPKSKSASSKKNQGDAEAPKNASGIMMILSPAKTLDLNPLPDSVPKLKYTMPMVDLDKTKEIAEQMKHRSQADLAKLLGVSANIAKTSHEYWKNFDLDQTPDDEETTIKPCIYSFSGAAYQGLQALKCSEEAMRYLQNNLRIVDPLYGVLRPLDKMQPYRLEMATRNVFGKSKEQPAKLNEYWKPSVTQFLSNELNQRSEKILLNLASDEYAAAVDPAELKEKTDGVKYVKAVFWEQGRVVAVHAKRARGLMARFLADTQAKTLDDVRKFAEEGYKLVEEDSDDSTVVFDRPKQEKKGGTKRIAADTTSSKAAAKKKGRKTTK